MQNSLPKIIVTNTSGQPKFGIKGAKAAEWLLAQKLTLPNELNSWQLFNENSLILRLGISEFLVEDFAQEGSLGAIVSFLQQSIQNKSPHVYYVPRADAAFVLKGAKVLDLLSEICMLDLTFLADSNSLYMTQIAGISATILNNNGHYHLWCDGSYERYMHDTLTQLSYELNEGSDDDDSNNYVV